jgi:lipopolysaccharide export system protein LptC
MAGSREATGAGETPAKPKRNNAAKGGTKPKRNRTVAAKAVTPPVRKHDYIDRTRTTMTDAQRYTRFVTIAKRALLLAALALIAAVLAYSLQPREQNRVAMTFERIGKVSNDLAMIKPKLTGTDDDGNPFTVTADSAVQDGRSARRARLNNVQADMTLKDSGWMSATAKAGLVDATAKKLALWGGVSIFSDSGYELHTNEVHVDLANGVARGDHVVMGQGPLGSIRADRFTVDRQNQRIFLMGDVHMTIYAQGTKPGDKRT